MESPGAAFQGIPSLGGMSSLLAPPNPTAKAGLGLSGGYGRGAGVGEQSPQSIGSPGGAGVSWRHSDTGMGMVTGPRRGLNAAEGVPDSSSQGEVSGAVKMEDRVGVPLSQTADLWESNPASYLAADETLLE